MLLGHRHTLCFTEQQQQQLLPLQQQPGAVNGSSGRRGSIVRPTTRDVTMVADEYAAFACRVGGSSPQICVFAAAAAAAAAYALAVGCRYCAHCLLQCVAAVVRNPNRSRSRRPSLG